MLNLAGKNILVFISYLSQILYRFTNQNVFSWFIKNLRSSYVLERKNKFILHFWLAIDVYDSCIITNFIFISEGYFIQLDQKTVKTPLLNKLCAPTKPLALAIANEWHMQTTEIDTYTMPMVCNFILFVF